MVALPCADAVALNSISSSWPQPELFGGLVIETVGFPDGGPTLTVIESLELIPALFVAESVTVCVPSVEMRYANSDAPFPTGTPSTDHVADWARLASY